jgi:hypothetical protein
MAMPNENWMASNINASGKARLHIGHHIINNIHTDERHLSPEEAQTLREDAVLSSLESPEMYAREGAIDDACVDTYEWIFDKEYQIKRNHWSRPITNPYPSWLEHEHGMFFIAGKAGAGKSTFMRFLVHHVKTRNMLQHWAGSQDRSLLLASHFFWCSGSESQSSQEGLWRGILHSLLSQRRDLIKALFADRCKQGTSTAANVRIQSWSRRDLANALTCLVAQVENRKLALCLFIDGLDEFQGDERLLITELKQLLTSPYIKVCASSRPRNFIEHAFGHDLHPWKLALHDLTYNDIRQLVGTQLLRDKDFERTIKDESQRTKLVDRITYKADGVFLWAVLVVREILREILQRGTAEELWERLDKMPPELGGSNGLFHEIMQQSDPRYRKYMARLLILMLNTEDGLGWEEIHFLYQDVQNPAFVLRDCLQVNDEYRWSWQSTDEGDIDIPTTANEDSDVVDDDFSGTGSCHQLFAICYEDGHRLLPTDESCSIQDRLLIAATQQQALKWCPDFLDISGYSPGPRFIHRSVADYLRTPSAQQDLENYAGQDFDFFMTDCRLRLARARLVLNDLFHGWEFLNHISRATSGQRAQVRPLISKYKQLMDTGFLIRVGGESLYMSEWSRHLCYQSEEFTGQFSDLHLTDKFDVSMDMRRHAWYITAVAKLGASWYAQGFWTTVPHSERQAIGTILMAGLLVMGDHSPTRDGLERNRRGQFQLVTSLLSSGVDVNHKYEWTMVSSGEGKLQLSLWEAYVQLCEKEVARDEWAVSMGFLLLTLGHADPCCALPSGHHSLLSAMEYRSETLKSRSLWAEQAWDTYTRGIYAMLSEHRLLTQEEYQRGVRRGFLSRDQKYIPLSSRSES